jgi:hypothetical protein
MVRNPSFPQPNLVSADELFVDGVILPLQLLSHHNQAPQPEPDPPNSNRDSEPGPGPELVSVTTSSESTAGFTGSKRWRDIFKKSDKKNQDEKLKEKEKEKEKKEKEKEKKKVEKERKSGSGASSAELNINIWPFSRSRSAGNTGTRPKLTPGAPGTRKVNSAPCSRSNSAGESKSRKWPSSPGRPGVHLGRSSPVWQARRGGSGFKSSEPVVRGSEKINKKDVSDTRRARTVPGSGPKAKVLNLNVPMCIGYRHHLSCKSDEHSALGGSGAGAGSNRKNVTGGGGESNGGNLFNLRSLFTKKVY